jgi:hypothetical protein
MPQQKEFPHVSEALLKELDALFPEKCPDPNWDERKIWIKVGQRDVVRLLKDRFDRQVKQALQSNV